MRHRRIVTTVAAAFVLLLAASSASAAEFSLFGSIYDTDDLDSSIGLGVKVDIELGESAWNLGIRGSYYPELSAKLSDFIEDEDPDVDAFEVSALPLDLGVNYGFGEGENFFVGGGISYVFLDANRNLAIDEEVGWYLALGYKSGQEDGGISFFVEVLYRGLEATVEGNIDDVTFFEIDSALDGWALNVGVAWR